MVIVIVIVIVILIVNFCELSFEIMKTGRNGSPAGPPSRPRTPERRQAEGYIMMNLPEGILKY